MGALLEYHTPEALRTPFPRTPHPAFCITLTLPTLLTFACLFEMRLLRMLDFLPQDRRFGALWCLALVCASACTIVNLLRAPTRLAAWCHWINVTFIVLTVTPINPIFGLRLS